MAKVVLLNPPGKQLYLRDYYCSKVAKTSYLYEPVDFLLLSGILAERHEVQVLDCIALGMDDRRAFEYLSKAGAGAIIFLSGAVSWQEDRVFLEEVKNRLHPLLIGCGDLFLEDGAGFLKRYSFIDALILDFTSTAVRDYLEEGPESRPSNMVYRRNGEVVEGELVRARDGTYTVPMPRHDLFPQHGYRFPTVRQRPFATVLSDYGCPYGCRFCVVGRLGYKTRPISEVMAELEMLARTGVREIYFNDQTFGARRDRTVELCRAMIASGLGLSWQVWSRVDVVDEPLLRLMKTAGCHTIFFGVESANDRTLEAQQKGFDTGQVRHTFSLCKRLDIRTLATFVIGFPGESEADIRRTIRFALELDPDYASFNLLVPRALTWIRREALEKAWFRNGSTPLDQSGSYPVMRTDQLSAETVWKLRREAVRSFYLRPGYIWKRLKQLRTLEELRLQIRNAWAIFHPRKG